MKNQILKRFPLKTEADFKRLIDRYTRSDEGISSSLSKIYDDVSWNQLVSQRNIAFYYYIQKAAMKRRIKRTAPTRIKELQSLGGRLARLKNQQEMKDQKKKIEAEIQSWRGTAKQLKKQPDAYMTEAQFYWHYTIVLLYESFPVRRFRRPSWAIQEICRFMSIPEIGLNCTRDVIKAARRRFKEEEYEDGIKYFTYS